jgi:hypothetical protein
MINSGGRESFPKSLSQPSAPRLLLSCSQNVRNVSRLTFHVSRGLPFLTRVLSEGRVSRYLGCSRRY